MSVFWPVRVSPNTSLWLVRVSQDTGASKILTGYCGWHITSCIVSSCQRSDTSLHALGLLVGMLDLLGLRMSRILHVSLC